MISFDYTIDFGQSSLNKDKHYNIYFEGKILAQNVLLPHIIPFNKWQSSYDIIVENVECGSVKNFSITGQLTTINYTTQQFPTTNPVYHPPTTTVRPTETTLTTSTTTQLPKSINITSINVLKCTTLNDMVLANIIIKFSGNYSNKLLLQITNIDSNIIVRKFDWGIITTSEISYNLPIGLYKFEIKDVENDQLTDIKNNVSVHCPTPNFNIEYIPNKCGQSDAKLRIFNIKNANIFRYCFGDTFICDVNFNSPDATVTESMSEITVNLNGGQPIEYTNGDFITVRGFNYTEDDFTDVTIELTPCIKSSLNNVIFVTSSHKPTNISDRLSDNIITVKLMKNGKKINAPIDISISGYYSILSNTVYIQQKFDTIILKDTNSVIINKGYELNSEIFDTCISNIEPSQYLGTFFKNNSSCN